MKEEILRKVKLMLSDLDGVSYHHLAMFSAAILARLFVILFEKKILTPEESMYILTGKEEHLK